MNHWHVPRCFHSVYNTLIRPPSMQSLFAKPIVPKKCQGYCRGEAEGVTLLLCGGCKRVRWCSKNCQKAGWSDHKFNCQTLSIAKLQAAEEKKELVARGDPLHGSSLPRHLSPTALQRDAHRWKDVRRLKQTCTCPTKRLAFRRYSVRCFLVPLCRPSASRPAKTRCSTPTASGSR